MLPSTAVISIAASFLFMGLVVSAYGPILEHLSRRYSVSLPEAGATISIHFAGTLAGVLLAMRSMARLPSRATIVTATLVASAGCVAIALSAGWPVFVGAVFTVGLGFGALVIGLNQIVAYSEGGRRAALLTGLNGAYSAGAVLGPILVASFAAAHFTVMYLAAAAVVLATIPGALRIAGGLPVAAPGAPRAPSPVVFIFVCAFALYVALENGAGGWMPSHLESTGLTSVRAAAVTSGFWLALMTSRILISVLPLKAKEGTIVLIASIAASGALIVACAGSLAPAGYVLAGLAFAPIFPTGVVWLASLRPGDARATSWLYPASSIGGVAGPGAIGLVVVAFGVRWVPVVLALVAVAMTFAFWSASRVQRTG